MGKMGRKQARISKQAMSERLAISAKYFGYTSIIGLGLSTVVAFTHFAMIGILSLLEVLLLIPMELQHVLERFPPYFKLPRSWSERLMLDQGWVRGLVFCCFSLISFGTPNGICVVVGFIMILTGLLYAGVFFCGMSLDDPRLSATLEEEEALPMSDEQGASDAMLPL
uniref:Uncharacterized protein n=1 Tax=Cyanoptyche gloeocystis TaxID=77922 RepID=A0A7S2JP43_9EUKA|mmetsp:Transcript_959/g.1734  ORF Transcript_959/g.1734 Transcript_959/m.1734 type:complete len:168 (+) Transcript_959:47-550(+)